MITELACGKPSEIERTHLPKRRGFSCYRNKSDLMMTMTTLLTSITEPMST